MQTAALHEIVGHAVRRCLSDGRDVVLDGLGIFRRTEAGVTFLPASEPRIFIAYVIEDYVHAERLYEDLAAAGFSPWLDRRKLLPGQKWRQCIEHAIDTCDFFIACFSSKSVRKRGQFPYEVRYALRCADRMPLDDTFLVPVRLEDCKVPGRISSHMQYVDLFPDWKTGVAKLVRSIRQEWEARQSRETIASD